ncbi:MULTISPECIES: hypothetical protein [unclassified Saccharothrix]|uniref:hypothetical protein n=1 Tax=unclassified Saccharothrix TaxID=2593673 RepID=UPI00307E57C8
MPDLLPEILRAVVGMWSTPLRRSALTILAGRVAASPEAVDPDTIHPTWTAALRTVSAHPRPVQVHEVAALAAMGSPSGASGRVALRAFASALTKVGTWWD